LEEALLQLDAWLSSPSISILSEGSGYYALLRSVVTSSGVTGGAIHDARIAALCVAHGVSELWTADRDFLRFDRLRTRNPLVG
jgi:predicted nucleic acid-binding protein